MRIDSSTYDRVQLVDKDGRRRVLLRMVIPRTAPKDNHPGEPVWYEGTADGWSCLEESDAENAEQAFQEDEGD